MERQRVTAKRRLERGQASKYINHGTIKPGDKVVIACRVSTRDRRTKVPDRLDDLKQRVESMGATVVGECGHVGSGWDPYWLSKAAVMAKNHDAKIVAEATDRLVRHPGYHSDQWFDAQARTTDLEDLRWLTEGVELVTMLDPDASPSEERDYHTELGKQRTGNRGGRPRKPQQLADLTAIKDLWKRLPH